jgi:hypothetical protein
MRFVVSTVLASLFVLSCSHESSTPVEPASANIAGAYTFELWFICTRADIACISPAEPIQITQTGSSFSGALPRNGYITGRIEGSLLHVGFAYRFPPDGNCTSDSSVVGSAESTVSSLSLIPITQAETSFCTVQSGWLTLRPR